MGERYYSQLQIRNSKSIVKQLSMQSSNQLPIHEMSASDLEKYKIILNQTSQLSETILKNFTSVYEVLEKINGLQGLSAEKIEHLKIMADSISKATSNLNDERTVTGLKYLESIVKK
jgi:uncharacterized protein YkvS